VKNPLLKTTLRQTDGDFFEDKLIITAESDFTLEQLHKAKNMQEIENILQEIVGKELPIELQKGKIKLQSVNREEIKAKDITNIFG